MSGYIGAQPVPQATQHREAFTATASQTSFPTVGYTPQFVDVYLNGVKLAAADYTATNGSDIVLATGAAASDILEYVAYTPFEVADQTFTGTTTTDVLTTTGAFTSLGIDDNATSTAITIDASENVGIGTSPSELLHIKSTTADTHLQVEAVGAGLDARLHLYGNSTGVSQIRFGDEASINVGLLTYDHSDDSMAFRTNGALAATIDSGGNVGIGTASPATALHVEDSGNPTITLTGSAGAYSSILDLVAAGAGASIIQTSGGIDALKFNTSAGERMRIDSSGDVLFGCTSIPSATVYGAGFEEASAGRNVLNLSSSLTTNAYLAEFYNPNGRVGTIATSGSATAYNTSSDYRLKENILPIQGAADIVKAMQPVTYTFKADSTDWHDGFLAHELQELHPRAVTGSKDAVDEDGNPDYQGVDYSKLTPILTAALQEALNKIDALEARLTALEATP